MTSDLSPPDRWLSFALAFIGGYGDAGGFVLAKTFTGHITGSLVLGAVSVAARDFRGSLGHFLAIVCFLMGILLSVLVARLVAARRSWSLLATSMGIEVILIVASYFALVSHTAPGIELFVVCMSVALGLQNGAFSGTGGISVHTTYLTGMITGLITTGAQKYFFQTPSEERVADPKFKLLVGIWIAFVVGAGAGAAMVFAFRAAGVLGAAVLLLVILVRDVGSAHPPKSQSLTRAQTKRSTDANAETNPKRT
jgi:uncharacterized membrane protein YoaK (UPF0700 family)